MTGDVYTYEVNGRNGYFAIDEYQGTACIRLVTICRTRKQANEIAHALTDAYRRGVEVANGTHRRW